MLKILLVLVGIYAALGISMFVVKIRGGQDGKKDQT